MRCTKCGTESTTSRKFCAACGSPLSSRCPKCGAENAPSSAYCEDCGAALAGNAASAATGSTQAASTASEIRVTPEQQDPSKTIDGERKTVTALFADIKGSTELMEDLDPEEARAIVDPALKLMIEAVRRYDGYVVQSTGDGIFALFGAPAAHEDHPQRALYAALRMQDELKRYSDRMRLEGRLPLQARVGVNTGEVVVRSIQTGEAHAEYTPIGHTANLAARMQVLAPIGSIAATEQVRKLCEGYFLFNGLGPTKVKGVSEPVNVYEVAGLGQLRTRLQRSAGRGLTKFVGRDREMEALKHAAEQAKSGHGQIVAAMAEPGVGKSRLFFEFKATSQSGWMVLETISVSHGKASAYLPVIDLLRNYFDITVADDERKRREKVAGKITILDRSLEDTLPYLFALLGIVEGDDPLAQMDGQIRKRRTLEAIKRIVLRESLNQPLMVIFEDLHWIDEQTQELLNLLADSIGTAKFLLLVNYRPEYSHQWSSKTYYTQLRLDPLGRESAEEMLSALLGTSPAPAAQSPGASRERSSGDLQAAGRVRVQDSVEGLKRLIIERTEGNPFFMEETVQVLLDEGALVRDGSAVKLTKSLSALKIPPTVQGILAARIDRLPVAQKELLQTLAVIGREFALSLVRRVFDGRKNDELERMLADLQMAEFIYEQPATGDIEYIFKHALTQEVSYNSLLIERRKLLHERTGQALESMFAGQLDDHLDELAHHYSRSDNVEKAVEYLGRAGQQAMRRSLFADAIITLDRAINLLQKLPDRPERIQRELLLQLAVGPALIAVKGYTAPETERAYTRARELCERLGNPPKLFPALLLGLWAVHLVRGELRASYELAEQLLRRAQSVHDPRLLMHAHQVLGVTSFYMGELLRAREHHETALSLYDPERHRSLAVRYGGIDVGVNCLLYAAWILWHLGYPDQALKKGNQALALAVGHPHSLAYAEFFVGVLRQFRREARATQENAESAISLSAEHRLTDFFVWVTSLRGWVIVEQGRTEVGIAQIREGLTAARATGAELNRPYYLTLLAETCMKTGRVDEGKAALTDALASADQYEQRNYEPEIHRLRGELLLKHQAERCGAEQTSPRGASKIDDSNATEAQNCFQRAIEIARKQSAKSLELRATMSLARLVDKQGRRAEARTMLTGIYGWFTEGFDTADLKDAKALLDQLAT
jgi:predicted ATPase/class 3 adenylate cyclase